MTVYAEVLFLENFITGLVILMLTGKLRGAKTEKWRIMTGAVMCGLYAFVLFVPLHWLLALGSKILFSAMVATAAFGVSTWRQLLKNAGAFCIVSFLMGGVTIALMYMLKIPGMTGNGSFVLKGASFLQISAGVAATWYLGTWLAELLKDKLLRQKVMHQVMVEIAGNRWHLKALTDTGNSLKEPVSGWPVAVLSKEAAERIRDKCDSECFAKLLAIPYRTVERSGVMFGIRPDRVAVDGRDITHLVLGFGESSFSPWKGTEKYDLLLHQQFLEGED